MGHGILHVPGIGVQLRGQCGGCHGLCRPDHVIQFIISMGEDQKPACIGGSNGFFQLYPDDFAGDLYFLRTRAWLIRKRRTKVPGPDSAGHLGPYAGNFASLLKALPFWPPGTNLESTYLLEQKIIRILCASELFICESFIQSQSILK